MRIGASGGVRMKQLRNEGFTLVEILMTIAFIALILAIVIPVIRQAQEEKRRRQAENPAGAVAASDPSTERAPSQSSRQLVE